MIKINIKTGNHNEGRTEGHLNPGLDKYMISNLMQEACRDQKQLHLECKRVENTGKKRNN